MSFVALCACLIFRVPAGRGDADALLVIRSRLLLAAASGIRKRSWLVPWRVALPSDWHGALFAKKAST